MISKCTKCGWTKDTVQHGVCLDCSIDRRDLLHLKNLPDLTVFLEEAKKRDNLFFSTTPPEVKPHVPGKPPISLIPREAIFEMARSFDYGSGKHGKHAFRDGVEFSKLLDAAMRHCLAMTDGEDIDEESGTLHAACAMSNLAMLIFMMKQHPQKDDRWKKK